MHPIDLTDVRKTYRGRVQALRGVRMQVHAGEIFGLLGPNGAGKSTLVKIMMTVVRPTHAEGTLLGRRVGHKATLQRVGYLPEHHRFPQYLTGRQAVELFGGLAGMRRPDRRRRTEEMLDIVRMREWADRRFGTYSKGMQQRVGLAAAMVNDPELVFLDEPTDGVDPLGRREIRDVLVQLREQGKTIFVNSHLLSELEMVCDRVAIMVQGQVVAQGTLEQLTASSRHYEIVIAGSAPAWMEQSTAGLASSAAAAPGGHAPTRDGTARLLVASSDAAAIQPIIDRLRSEGRTIVSITPARESLEDLFMRAVTDPNTGATLGPGAAPAGARRSDPGAERGAGQSPTATGARP
ncbi:MAG: ABC transporter ATP-binding protein [Phycisphaerales bacterium]